MTFLKPHLRRKSSARQRPESLETSAIHQSETSQTLSIPASEQQDDIKSEVDNLFKEATHPTRDRSSEDSKTDSSLFRHLMRRKASSSKSTTGLTAGIRRSFSHRVRTKSPTGTKFVEDAVTRGSSPDFASETGYDSDAAFIASPRFSEQSWDSVRPSSPTAIARTFTSLDHILANEISPQAKSNDDSEVTVLLSTRPQLNVLSISRRRKRVDKPVDKNNRVYSRWVPSISLSKEGERRDKTVETRNIPRKTRFAELFDHPGLQDEAPTEKPRKVSIGWMSDGKRCGYGYSFVDKDENNPSGATDGPTEDLPTTKERDSDVDQDDASNASFITAAQADDSSKTEECVSSTDVTLVDDCQDADLFSQPNVDISSGQEDKQSFPEPERNPSQVIANHSSEPELVSSSYRYVRWSLFPSYTRSERNKSTDPDSTVIVRDFCTKPSPDQSELEEEHGEEKKHHLATNAIRQGIHDTFLWAIGLGKREIARYHAGFQMQAARSHENVESTFEMTVPFWDQVPREELGDYHIEAWKAAKRRSKKRSGGNNLEKWKVSVNHAVAAARKAYKKSARSSSSSSSLASLSQRFRDSMLCDLDKGTKYVGRRRSANF